MISTETIIGLQLTMVCSKYITYYTNSAVWFFFWKSTFFVFFTYTGRLINSQQGSWITGILSLGCFFGCILAGPMMEKFGRKKTLMYFTSLWFFLGYLLIFLANNIAQVYIGRYIFKRIFLVLLLICNYRCNFFLNFSILYY